MAAAGDDFTAAREVIRHGLAARAFPAAVVEVGTSAGPRWQEAFGRLSYDADAPPCTVDTIFDLASLTKVIATASLAMAQIGTGRLELDTPAGAILPEWADGERAAVTVRHLLDHSSGLPAHARLWTTTTGRAAYRNSLAALPLERQPGTAAVYSDPGFLVLGLLLEENVQDPLDAQLARLGLVPPAAGPLLYHPGPDLLPGIAPTEHDAWRGRTLQGEVHDENAFAIGGVAAHAGLFGTVGAVGAFARLVLETFQQDTVLGTPHLMRTFATRSLVPGSSRALAWDTALPTSSCGTKMSPAAIGHTGFTGTSLWIDRDRDRYVVLLTNRVHPSRANEGLVRLRPVFHDALPL